MWVCLRMVVDLGIGGAFAVVMGHGVVVVVVGLSPKMFFFEVSKYDFQ
jgi:hypothetical protein